MTAHTWIETFRRIPAAEQCHLVVVMQNGLEISVDVVQRLESHYAVIRGRQGGTTDEARGFFVPYDQILFLKLDRVVKLEELDALFGASAGPVAETPVNVPSMHPTPAAPLDPAAASRLLLERIRHARTQAAPRMGSQQG